MHRFFGRIHAALLSTRSPDIDQRRRITVPGIRNYVEYGGIGLLVYDMDDGHRFVKRIPTLDVPAGRVVGRSTGSPSDCHAERAHADLRLHE